MAHTTIRVATLPRGKDVDELLNTEGGAAAFRAAIDNAVPAPTWMINNLDQRHDLTTVKGAVDACEDMIDVLLRQPPIARGRYVAQLAEKLGEDERTIRQTLNEAIRDREAHYQAYPEDRPLMPNPALFAARLIDI